MGWEIKVHSCFEQVAFGRKGTASFRHDNGTIVVYYFSSSGRWRRYCDAYDIAHPWDLPIPNNDQVVDRDLYERFLAAIAAAPLTSFDIEADYRETAIRADWAGRPWTQPRMPIWWNLEEIGEPRPTLTAEQAKAAIAALDLPAPKPEPSRRNPTDEILRLTDDRQKLDALADILDAVGHPLVAMAVRRSRFVSWTSRLRPDMGYVYAAGMYGMNFNLNDLGIHLELHRPNFHPYQLVEVYARTLPADLADKVFHGQVPTYPAPRWQMPPQSMTA